MVQTRSARKYTERGDDVESFADTKAAALSSQPTSMPTSTLLVGGAWFACSALLSTYANTAFLNEFKSPLGHTFVRFAGAALLSGAALGPARCKDLVGRAFRSYAWVGLLLFVANFANSVALQMTGITVTYVVKAAIPVFTVGACALIYGQSFPLAVYAALVPTVVGVALASASDSGFAVMGLVAALVSCAAQTGMNLGGKRVADSTGVVGFPAFFIMATVATILCAPLFALSPEASGNSPVFQPALAPLFGEVVVVGSAASGGALEGWFGAWKPAALIILAAVAYQLEYSLNFVFVSMVDPVTFSVCDIVRRLAVIITGAVVFQKPLTGTNISGIALALGGVLAYSLVQSSSAKEKSKRSA